MSCESIIQNNKKDTNVFYDENKNFGEIIQYSLPHDLENIYTALQIFIASLQSLAVLRVPLQFCSDCYRQRQYT